MKNFYPDQYKNTDNLKINHNYLGPQFADFRDIFEKLAEVVQKGDYTLGSAVDEFEEKFARICNSRYAIGVGSGTDALFLSLKALNIGHGDEVIVPTFTFYATVGAIVTAGARPIFVDSAADFNIDVSKIEDVISAKTKAIMPVHWSGKICQMDKIIEIANKFNLAIIEDACHAITAEYMGKRSGSFGTVGCFSLHPLKNLNVWGDGGVIVTNNSQLNEKLRLLRNHGLTNRDTCAVFAYNSRLDTVQAVIADHLLTKLDHLTERRIANASQFDKELSNVDGVTIPPRTSLADKQVFHIYPLLYKKRDKLIKFLHEKGIDAKVHYPTPMHLQPAAKKFRRADDKFPIAEALSQNTLSLPVHEFITENQLEYMIASVKEFYS